MLRILCYNRFRVVKKRKHGTENYYRYHPAHYPDHHAGLWLLPHGDDEGVRYVHKELRKHKAKMLIYKVLVSRGNKDSFF
ncbi:MAG: hypothetical protein ABI707_01190 [Ferruginibacter sp.]